MTNMIYSRILPTHRCCLPEVQLSAACSVFWCCGLWQQQLLRTIKKQHIQVMWWLRQTTDRRVSTGNTQAGHLLCTYSHRDPDIMFATLRMKQTRGHFHSCPRMPAVTAKVQKSNRRKKGSLCVLTSSFTPVAYCPLRCGCVCVCVYGHTHFEHAHKVSFHSGCLSWGRAQKASTEKPE